MGHIRGAVWLCANLWLLLWTGEPAVMLATAWLLISWVPRDRRRGTSRVTMFMWRGRPAAERSPR